MGTIEKTFNAEDFMNKDYNATQMKNPLVIYHGNCADGFSAAWVFHNMSPKIEQTFEFHAGIYSDPPPDVEGRIVYLVDFSYKRHVVEEMLLKATHVYLIDHHKTAIEDLLSDGVNYNGLDTRRFPNFTAYCDLNRSGAMLAWDFWNNTVFDPASGSALHNRKPEDFDYVSPPPLLEHIQDRDLWQFKLPLTRAIQANVFSYEYTFENWDMLMGYTRRQLASLAAGGMAIERKHHKDIKELVDVCRRLGYIGGHLVPIASLPYTLSSDAGHLMASEYKDGTAFAANYWDTATHRIFSLRSCDNGIDVSAVAKLYGGGGHRNAAGFRVNREHDLARF